MYKSIDGKKNRENSKKEIGYVDLENASPATYDEMGFKCGLEVHQQLRTEKKLFCRCPAGIYQEAAAQASAAMAEYHAALPV